MVLFFFDRSNYVHRQDCDPTWEITMKKLLLATAATALMAGAASAEDVKIGVLWPDRIADRLYGRCCRTGDGGS
jgi:hypothetical protein